MPDLTGFKWTAAAVILLIGAGCGGGSQEGSMDANMAEVDEDSPEFAAMQYRQA